MAESISPCSRLEPLACRVCARACLRVHARVRLRRAPVEPHHSCWHTRAACVVFFFLVFFVFLSLSFVRPDAGRSCGTTGCTGTLPVRRSRQHMWRGARCKSRCALRDGERNIRKAGSTLRSSRAVPHPSTNRALRRLTSEVGRDPEYSTRYGRQRQPCQTIHCCIGAFEDRVA